jgi:hypothetical protein
MLWNIPMSALAINFTTINLPSKPSFPDQINKLVDKCVASKGLVKKQSQKAVDSRFLHCHTLIEGLYQIWCCRCPEARLNVFRSPQYYHSTKQRSINHLSQYFVVETVDALETLGWAEVVSGERRTDSANVPTQLKAAGELLHAFEKIGIRWSKVSVPAMSIVLRGYDPDTKERFPMKPAMTSSVRTMNANLRKINLHLSTQAICLHVSNDHLGEINRRMSEPKYRWQGHNAQPQRRPRLLNFNHRLLRRVFSRGSMELGGRFYGGWWQYIPSENRPYITINGSATTEIDFSELHPRLLYISQGLAPPSGDLYDVGLHIAGQPYDAAIEPYKSQRKLVKEVFNALLNDETNRYRPSDKEMAKAGITFAKLKQLIIKRHPPLKEALGKGVGLQFQYKDSIIAEKVMLSLFDHGITCLPVHDSFIVPAHQWSELQTAMDVAFAEVMPGQVAKRKKPTKFSSDFRMTFLPNGELDQQALFEMHDSAIHNKYVHSRTEFEPARRRKPSK